MDVRSFAIYAPIVEEVQAAHSIVFSVLGDHGWIGLLLSGFILALGWRSASWVIAQSRGDPSLSWAAGLMRMIHVSLLAYLVGGAFLSLAYFDLPWHLIAIVLICHRLTEQHLIASKRLAENTMSATEQEVSKRWSRVPTHTPSGVGDHEQGSKVTRPALDTSSDA
jgi:hypothetical protein